MKCILYFKFVSFFYIFIKKIKGNKIIEYIIANPLILDQELPILNFLLIIKENIYYY